jgi:NAD(P)-dependent dehydrogenase (short-subunit alcohol dehydrogenase family)
VKRVAVVTGGSGGLGSAICSELGGRGYDVVDWSRSRGVDAADEEHVEAAASALPRWDALVNNAAVLIPRLLAEMSADEWDETLRCSLRSAFLCSRAAFRSMKPGGSIVMVSSLSGFPGAEKFPHMSAYVAAKSALHGLTEALAVEGRPLGIRVNAVSPGSIRTKMLDRSGAPKEPAFDPGEVARVIGWLVSPESAPLSGADIRLDPV